MADSLRESVPMSLSERATHPSEPSLPYPYLSHPFLGETSPVMATPLTVVIFGASGDLTARKLIPALFNLARKWEDEPV